MAAPRFNILRPVSHEAWLQARANGIGASEVGTILGVNPYDSPYRLWRRKIGVDEPVTENRVMRLGHILEDAVAQLWQSETGRKIIIASKGDWLMQDAARPFMQVSPDRTYWLSGSRSPLDKGILECKTTRIKVTNDDIPLYWFAQVQYQLMVSGYPQASLAWLINGLDFGYQDFEPSPEYHEIIRESVARFWLENVLGRKEPDAVDADDVMLKFPLSRDSQAFADEVTASNIDEYRRVTAELAALNDRKERLAGELKVFMGESERLVDPVSGKTLATWKSPKASSKFDEKRFKAEHPDMWQDYQFQAQGSRRFLVK